MALAHGADLAPDFGDRLRKNPAMRAARPPRTARPGDNGGPPLDDPRPHVPEIGKGEIGHYFDWRFASRRAWRKGGPEIALRRLERAETIGLTYEEYTLEVLERGRHVGAADAAAIKAKRPERRATGGIVGQSLKGKRLR
jgi:hypothetical protein